MAISIHVSTKSTSETFRKTRPFKFAICGYIHIHLIAVALADLGIIGVFASTSPAHITLTRSEAS